jgi:acetylornithine/succinyldiaminopimelate/putrescine aminotransferase
MTLNRKGFPGNSCSSQTKYKERLNCLENTGNSEITSSLLGIHVWDVEGKPYYNFLSGYSVVNGEKMIENVQALGVVFKRELKRLPRSVVTKVRSKGLLTAIDINSQVDSAEVLLKLKEKGILATLCSKTDVIRFYPPSTIKENQVREAAQLIIETAYCFDNWYKK